MNHLSTTSTNPGASQHRTQAGMPVTCIREFPDFKLGTEEYGMDMLRVQEIRFYEEPTRMANTPSFIKGVINLRGVIVPILDMRIKFNLEQVNYDTPKNLPFKGVEKRVAKEFQRAPVKPKALAPARAPKLTMQMASATSGDDWTSF